MSAKVSPSLHTHDPEASKRRVRYDHETEGKYPLLCSITRRRQGGLVPEDTVFHPEDPNSSPCFGKHPPSLSVLEQLMKGAIPLEAIFEVFFRERLICEMFVCL